MADHNGAAPADDMVPAAHVLKCLSFAIREIEREQVAMILFEIAAPPMVQNKFAVTIPVSGLAAFRSLVNDVIKAAEKAKLGTGMAAMYRPNEVQIGDSAHMRGCVVVSFNPRADDEEIFLIPDHIALDMADAIQKNVFGRMSEGERRQHLQRQSKIIAAPKPKLILPT